LLLWFVRTQACHGPPPQHMIAIMPASLFAYLDELPWREVTLDGGQRLFLRGDPVTSTFWVTAGGMLLIRHHGNGAALVLQRAGPGDVLAEASLFATEYHCDAVAEGTTTVRSVRRATVLSLLGNDSTFAATLAAHLASETQKARFRAELLTLRTVAERLDAWLSLHEGTLPDRGQWRPLAHALAVSPEALYRELARRR
jgi:CRP/FNR family transcriptional regulator, dissimilatory nitrate respiration regulator